MTVKDDSASGTVPANEKGELKAGMIGDVKNLYQSKPDNRGKTTWVQTYPDDLTAAAEDSETAKYALLVRNKKCYNGRKSLEIDSLVIQSPLLKESLGCVLKDYPGVTTSLDRLTFKAPFKEFVHRWKALVKALDNESDLETKSHLKLLHRILETELRDDLKALDDYILNGVITYDIIWMLFEPGELVFGSHQSQPAVGKLVQGSYQQTRCGDYYDLQTNTVDWDGENFGYDTTRFRVPAFLGTAKITKLAAFPFSYHPKMEKVKADLIERGRAFEAFGGSHYKHYEGIAIGQGPWGPIKYNVDSRIIIDTYAWNRFNPNRQVSLNRINNRTNSDGSSWDDEDYDSDEDDSYSEVSTPDPDCAGGDGKPEEIKPASGLTEAQLLMCNCVLRGYSLRNKKWLEFAIAAVRDIKFSTGAFDSLVLPQDHKELILALTESQAKNKETFDDVIQGKGKGMIMLLSGPPGVGKTLTAESVAENMKAPLYMMSAGDLGLEASDVETNLSNVLEMATKWNAVLLLDEADVFLEQRSAHDLERNKLVSIFLRILEYYEGILFLTTNRVDNIDAAFQSRIHVSMQYEDLSTSSRKHIWSNFTAIGGKSKGGKAKWSFSEKDLDRLAQYELNGREIKNVLKTAQLLASKKGETLGASHVEAVLAIEQRKVDGGKGV